MHTAHYFLVRVWGTLHICHCWRTNQQ